MPEATEPQGGTLLLVLGMHRSGTSLLSGLLHGAGMDLGKDLMPPAEDNPRGFWENQAIATLHEDFLANFEQSWASYAPLPRDWSQSAAANALCDALEALLDSEFEQQDRICVKDPRLCRLLPVWQHIAERRAMTLRGVSIIRPAEEVTASLAKRDGISAAHGRALWLRYNLDWAAHCDLLPVLRTSYQRLLQQPQDVLAEVEQFTGLSLSADQPELVDQSLQHHRSSGEDIICDPLYELLAGGDTPVSPLYQEAVMPLAAECADLERRLAGLASGSLSADELASAREQNLFDQAQEAKQFASSMKQELDTGRAYIEDMEAELATRQEYAANLEQEIAAREQDIDEKGRFIESLQTQQTTLQAELELRQNYVDSLRVELERRQEYAESLQSEQEALNAELARREEYNASLQEALGAKDSDLAALGQALEAERAGHQEFVQAHKEFVQAHQEDIARREEYTQSLVTELEQVRAIHAEAEAALQELRHRFRHLITIGNIFRGKRNNDE